MTRLVLCAVALVACIIFSVLLLSGTLDGKTGGNKPLRRYHQQQCPRRGR